MASETGVKIVVEVKDLQKVKDLVSRLAEFDEHDLVTNILNLGENQTRKRILAGGPAPDGALWPPNREGILRSIRPETIFSARSPGRLTARPANGGRASPLPTFIKREP
jgi:hypothetical protein